MQDQENHKEKLRGMDLFSGLEMSPEEAQGFFKTIRLLGCTN